MIEVYCKLIMEKRRTFASVPEVFKERVQVRLAELGRNTDGDPIGE